LDVIRGYAAYSGTYTVDERARTLTHHRRGSLFPADPADAVRQYDFSDDRLVLTTPGQFPEKITWERMK
jgi:hypothetical protein